MQEKATKLYVRVNATQPASGVALRFLIQDDEKSKEIDEVADDVASDDGKISEEQIQEHYVLNVGQEANKSN